MGKNFGRKLRDLRGNQSQSEIARLFNVGQTTYSNWENGKNEPPFITFRDICQHYGVSADWLLGLSDSRSGAAMANASGHGNAAAATGGPATVECGGGECAALRELVESQKQIIALQAAEINRLKS